MFESVSEKIKDAKKIVFVTGAGISQESGIPTFRGTDGLWRKYDPMQLATIDAFNDDPKLVWEWYEERRKNILDAKPNPGHVAIAELEKFQQLSSYHTCLLQLLPDSKHFGVRIPQTKLHLVLKC